MLHASPLPNQCPRQIWQLPDWLNLTYDAAALVIPMTQVHRAQSHLMGRMAELGTTQRERATLPVLTQEVIKTSEIEGKRISLDAVRRTLVHRTQPISGN